MRRLPAQLSLQTYAPQPRRKVEARPQAESVAAAIDGLRGRGWAVYRHGPHLHRLVDHVGRSRHLTTAQLLDLWRTMSAPNAAVALPASPQENGGVA